MKHYIRSHIDVIGLQLCYVPVEFLLGKKPGEQVAEDEESSAEDEESTEPAKVKYAYKYVIVI